MQYSHILMVAFCLTGKCYRSDINMTKGFLVCGALIPLIWPQGSGEGIALPTHQYFALFLLEPRIRQGPKELVLNAALASGDSFLPRSLERTIFNWIKNFSKYIMTFQNIELVQICLWIYMALNSSLCLEGFLSLLQANHFSLRVVKVVKIPQQFKTWIKINFNNHLKHETK